LRSKRGFRRDGRERRKVARTACADETDGENENERKGNRQGGARHSGSGFLNAENEKDKTGERGSRVRRRELFNGRRRERFGFGAFGDRSKSATGERTTLPLS
jgi:hypothetical protein